MRRSVVVEGEEGREDEEGREEAGMEKAAEQPCGVYSVLVFE